MAIAREQISPRQGTMLVINLILPTATLFLPAISAVQAHEDAWLTPLIAAPAGMVMALIYTALSNRFPGRTLIQFAPQALGRSLGGLVGLLYLWWWLQCAAHVTREFGEFMTIIIMPQTPIIVFHLLILLLVAYGSRHGLETMARANEIILPVMLFTLFLLFALVANHLRGSLLLPFMAEGIRPVLRGAYAPASWMGEVVTCNMMIFPFLPKPQQARPVVMRGLAVVGLLLCLNVAMNVGVLGAHLTRTAMLPMMSTARLIDIADILVRMEPFFVAVWIGGLYVKIWIFFYAFCRGAGEWLGLRDYRPLILPGVTLCVPLSILLFDNATEMSQWHARVWPAYALLVFELGLPLLLLAGALITGRRRRKSATAADSPA
ncbi:MAG TPA: endospore germination permease [Symbiobacteriaceae bacterium]|nr:endospore germination permease [Symbiobacteriaceae bacterium]